MIIYSNSDASIIVEQTSFRNCQVLIEGKPVADFGATPLQVAEAVRCAKRGGLPEIDREQDWLDWQEWAAQGAE